MSTVEFILFVAMLAFALFCIVLTVKLDKKQKELSYYVTVNDIVDLLMQIDALEGKPMKSLPLYWNTAANYVMECRDIQALEDHLVAIIKKYEEEK